MGSTGAPLFAVPAFLLRADRAGVEGLVGRAKAFVVSIESDPLNTGDVPATEIAGKTSISGARGGRRFVYGL